MKVAQVICRTDVFGGACRHVLDLSAALLRRGHEVRIFTGPEGPVSALYRAAGLPVTPLPSFQRALHPLRDLAALAALRSALRDFAPDVVAAHASKAGALARPAAASLGLPCTYTPHCWSFAPSFPRARLYLQAERALARLPAQVICVCQWEQQLALDHGVVHADRLHVIPNGVDAAPPTSADPSRQPPRLLCLSRFEPQKDHTTLLHALAALRDLPWSAQFAGDGPTLPAARELAGRLGLTDRIDFCGFVANPANALANAQLLALPSRWEALPLTLLEAMQCGLPVAATAVGGVPEAVLDGETGLLVPPGDSPALANALHRLLASPEERVRMGLAGRRRHLECFTLEAMVRATESLYASLVEAALRSRTRVRKIM